MRGVRPLAIIVALIIALLAGVITNLVFGSWMASAHRQPYETSVELLARLHASVGYNVGAILLGALTDVLMGFIAAKLGRAAPRKNAIICAILMIAIRAPLFPLLSTMTPRLLAIASFVIVVPAVLLGARLATRAQRRTV